MNKSILRNLFPTLKAILAISCILQTQCSFLYDLPDFSGGKCPCAEGWTCDTSKNVCIKNSDASVDAGWIEEWNSNPPVHFSIEEHRPTSFVNFSTTDNRTRDGHALELRMQPMPNQTNGKVLPGPDHGVEADSYDQQLYGSFSSRLRTANCADQSNVGVVTGLLTYFNSGTDSNGNGIPDHSEIDFEWLCAKPEIIYLTMWTEYDEITEKHKRIDRMVNISTGEIISTCYYEDFDNCHQLFGDEASPTNIRPIPGYDSSAAYYVYGFDWAADHVRWWMCDQNSSDNCDEKDKIVLWNYSSFYHQERIARIPAYFLTIIWHTNDWYPPGLENAVEAPKSTVSAWVDWTQYSPLP